MEMPRGMEEGSKARGMGPRYTSAAPRPCSRRSYDAIDACCSATEGRGDLVALISRGEGVALRS